MLVVLVVIIACAVPVAVLWHQGAFSVRASQFVVLVSGRSIELYSSEGREFYVQVHYAVVDERGVQRTVVHGTPAAIVHHSEGVRVVLSEEMVHVPKGAQRVEFSVMAGLLPDTGEYGHTGSGRVVYLETFKPGEDFSPREVITIDVDRRS
jgi:hypothetical protein